MVAIVSMKYTMKQDKGEQNNAYIHQQSRELAAGPCKHCTEQPSERECRLPRNRYSSCSHCPWPFAGCRPSSQRGSRRGQRIHYRIRSEECYGGPAEIDLPKVHTVDERFAAVSGPCALVGELADIPHELVHDLWKLDRKCRRA